MSTAWRGVRPWLWLVVPFALVAMLVLFPDVAFARGGGGGHSGGGGGGGGHSSGGGSSGGGGGSYSGGGGYSGSSGYGAVGFGLLGAFLGSGFIGLLVIILIIWGLRSVMRSGQTVQTEPSYAPASDEQGLAEIKAADPNFEVETFMQRSQMAFFLVKQAWQKLDVHAGRPYLAPELYQSWSASVEQMRSQGMRPVLENLNVQGMVVTSAQKGESRDSILVHFDMVAAAHFVNAETGQFVSGSKNDEQAGEDWRFERDAGVQTVVSGGVTAEKCPSCGAPLQLDEVGQCRFCKADVTSGKFDWVVVSMEPSQFFGGGYMPMTAASAESTEDGIARIKAADPAFDPQTFMSRAYQGFMALEKSWMDRNLEEGRQYMSPGLYMSWSSQVQQMIQLHKQNILENLRVTNMQVAKVAQSNGFDDLTVRIDAVCADYEVEENTGKVIFGQKKDAPFTEYWTFQRSLGAQTRNGSIMEKVCPNCGAPLTINQVGECGYCRAAVLSGQFDWVLSRIDQENEWRG